MELVDLSHPLSLRTPIFPGSEPPSLSRRSTIEKDGFNEWRISFDGHLGTHLDAPAHILPGAPSLDGLPLGQFYGRAVLLDVTSVRARPIDPKDLEARARMVSGAEFVLLRTGWDRHWGQAAYFKDFPCLSGEGAAWLGRLPLKGVGVDAPSFDPLDSPLPVHRALLGRGLVLIENLRNLQSLPDSFFTLACFPLPIEGVDGLPVRAVAIVDRTRQG